MTKQEFFEAFYKDYPYSCITIKDMQIIIETYPEDVMPFKINSAWSWRGIYAHPCLDISVEDATKDENLRELRDVLRYEYQGWKGGMYKYEESSLVHFEADWGNSTIYDEDTCYFIQFIKEHEDNSFVQHMLNYFIENKQEDVEYYQDVLGHDLVIGNKVVYYNDFAQQLTIGYILDVNKQEKLAIIVDVPVYLVKDDTIKQEITFDRIAQVDDL